MKIIVIGKVLNLRNHAQIPDTGDELSGTCLFIGEINDLLGMSLSFIPLYEQEPMDQVGAENVELPELREAPAGREVQNVEICFTGSFAPHFGHTGGDWVDESRR